MVDVEPLGWSGQARELARAVVAPLSLSARGWRWLSVYMVAASLLLGGVACLLMAYQDDLLALLTRYLLPGSWRFAGELLVTHLLASQTREVLLNAIASGALVLVALFLFPIKEQVSLAYEEDRHLTQTPLREFPLWFQGLEELKLLLIYITAFMLIFWIGYAPDPARKHLATALSHLFLSFTFTVDFIAPLLQRHRLRYSQVIKTLLAHPLASLGFGVFFALPSIAVGLTLKRQPDLPLIEAVVLLFGVNILALLWAAVAGTYLGSRLLEPGLRRRRTAWPLRLAAWLSLALLLGSNCVVFFSLGRSIHHKSQLLKCRYSVDLSSIKLDLPELKLRSALTTLLSGSVSVGAQMDVEVANPTPFHVEVERNRIEIKHQQTLIASTSLQPMRIEAGQRVRSRLGFSTRLNHRSLLKGRELLTRGWSVTLFLEIRPGLELPIYLLSPAPNQRSKD